MDEEVKRAIRLVAYELIDFIDALVVPEELEALTDGLEARIDKILEQANGQNL